MNSEKVKEIKKALEFCTSLKKRCRDCDYNEIGCYKLLKDILTLINELEKENADYKDTNNILRTRIDKSKELSNRNGELLLKQFAETLKKELQGIVGANFIDEILKEFIK